ncbi:hypothetical protein BJV74DRAFT_316933 [Russula compacta]|nr:hypothetical protein BJV74DRAFT_316933 [Russula compacta]
MDRRNNQLNPQNTQNGQQTNAISADLNHLLQSGVTPEQFAENARQLEAYSRMNAMALRVYLERQSQQAEQRRQDELHLVQLAQQLASGSQQQLQLPPPPAPLLPHSRHSLLPQQTTASSIVANRNAPVSYHTTNAASSQHWSHRGPAHVPIVQHQQPYHASVPSVHRNVYLPRETNRVSQPIGGGGPLAAVSHHKLSRCICR